jgi:hypothetical protein
MTGQVYSFSGKKEDVSFRITKAKAKCRSLERYLQRTPVPHAADGAWISAAEFFDWHGRPQDVVLEVYQQLSASVYYAHTTLPMQRLHMFYAYLVSRQIMVRLYSRNSAPPKAPLDSKF